MTVKELVKVELSSDELALVREALDNNVPVLVSGSTASGKTALAQAILRELPVENIALFGEDYETIQTPYAVREYQEFDGNFKFYGDKLDVSLEKETDLVVVDELSAFDYEEFDKFVELAATVPVIGVVHSVPANHLLETLLKDVDVVLVEATRNPEDNSRSSKVTKVTRGKK